MKSTIQIVILLFIMATISNCGRVAASPGAHAESIGGPPGVSCYAIISGDSVVGGNCIKN